MAEQRWVTVSYEDKDYQLGFTKQTVRLAESMGFNLGDLQTQSKVVAPITILFYSSFLAKQARIKEDLVDKIYDALDNKVGLISELVTLYSDTIAAMMEDGNKEEGKNATWSVLPRK